LESGGLGDLSSPFVHDQAAFSGNLGYAQEALGQKAGIKGDKVQAQQKEIEA
jgi:hypothetical protein